MSENIQCDDLVTGDDVEISPDAMIKGGKIEIGEGTKILSGVRINVIDSLVIGKNSLIREESIITGRNIKLGREFYTNHHAEIGGGSCFEKTSSLEIGYWFHLGSYSIVNTAMPVKIGNEVGLGRFSNLYTHGAYLSMDDGFPVSFDGIEIGDRVWMPSATVNPGVKIGDDVVIGVGSILSTDIPSGSLAIGNPCKVIKENYYPKKVDNDDLMNRLKQIFSRWDVKYDRISEGRLFCEDSVFHIHQKYIEGKVSKNSERLRNILRRHGIRFRIDIENDEYKSW